MKGRELTRIGLAQCTRSLCQSRLQRYNKVHRYNEAWAHLSMNCGVFRRTESLSWNVYLFFSLPLHFCTYYFGNDSKSCGVVSGIKLFWRLYVFILYRKKTELLWWETNPLLSSVSASFQYFNMQIDVSKIWLISIWPPGRRFPRKTRALFNSQPHWVILWKQSDYCWLIIRW